MYNPNYTTRINSSVYDTLGTVLSPSNRRTIINAEADAKYIGSLKEGKSKTEELMKKASDRLEALKKEPKKIEKSRVKKGLKILGRILGVITLGTIYTLSLTLLMPTSEFRGEGPMDKLIHGKNKIAQRKAKRQIREKTRAIKRYDSTIKRMEEARAKVTPVAEAALEELTMKRNAAFERRAMLDKKFIAAKPLSKESIHLKYRLNATTKQWIRYKEAVGQLEGSVEHLKAK